MMLSIGILFRLYKSKAYETDPSLSVDGEKDKGKSGLYLGLYSVECNF